MARKSVCHRSTEPKAARGAALRAEGGQLVVENVDLPDIAGVEHEVLGDLQGGQAVEPLEIGEALLLVARRVHIRHCRLLLVPRYCGASVKLLHQTLRVKHERRMRAK